MELCHGFNDIDWFVLRPKLFEGDEEAWEKAIRVVKARIEERFVSCIDLLLAADYAFERTPDGQKRRSDSFGRCVPGLAIMTLCCMFIEAIQSFVEGTLVEVAAESCGFPKSNCIQNPPLTSVAFKSFFRRPAFKADFDDDLSFRFSQDVRNALVHAC